MIIDLEAYDDSVIVKNYNLFIDPDGMFYRINRIKNDYSIDHNLWALEYFKKLCDIYDSKKLSPAEVLIHKYGFLYYSHDMLVRKPIVKVPNPKYYRQRVSEEELDSLFQIMLLNNEDPFSVPMQMGYDDVYDYVALTDEKKYEKGGLR